MLIRLARCRPTPPRQLPPGPAPQALVGSLGTLFVLSCTCTVARQLGLSCNTLARARRVFLFPSCSESFLRSCTRIAFAFPPRNPTHLVLGPQSPVPSPAGIQAGSAWGSEKSLLLEGSQAGKGLGGLCTALWVWESHPEGSWGLPARVQTVNLERTLRDGERLLQGHRHSCWLPGSLARGGGRVGHILGLPVPWPSISYLGASQHSGSRLTPSQRLTHPCATCSIFSAFFFSSVD